VAEWLGQMEPEQREAARFTAAINAALELRHRLGSMTDEIAAKEVRALV
jgi:hypothetical protein